MIDQAKIQVTSGNGGNGSVSGRREKFIPRGGPDGGDGGFGGNVYIVADLNITTLLDFRNKNRFFAGNGGNGMGGNRHGKKGVDITIKVPVGTQVWNNKTQTLILDMVTNGQSICIARGGVGGRGNTHFASPTNRFPLLAERGEAGTKTYVRFELKLIADVGIIGAPNAGKSSLLSSVSSATPKIANYPFTTIEPNLGAIETKSRTILVADIPGLIEGAHQGVGLGHDFLRHIDRTRILIHVIDVSAPDCLEKLQMINDELNAYNEKLLNKPQIIAMNKVDLADSHKGLSIIETRVAELSVTAIPISALTGTGIDKLMDELIFLLEKDPDLNTNDFELPTIRPNYRKEKIKIRRDAGVYIVDMSHLTRIAGMVDLSNWDVKIQFHRHLNQTGVIKELEKQGIEEGDVIRIGEFEFRWGD